MSDYFCAYEAEMAPGALGGLLSDRRWRGELDVKARSVRDAERKVAQYLKAIHPNDRYEINGRTQMAKIIDTRKNPLPLNDAARPFAVLFGGRVVGRYETEGKAKRRLRDLTPRATVQPLERNPFYDNVLWVRS